MENTIKKNKNLLIKGGIALILFLVVIWINPYSYNDPTERTVVTGQGGGQKVVFQPGIYFAGFFAHEESYPNQIGIQYKGDDEDFTLKENTVDIGKTGVSFLGGASATVTGIAQFGLPSDEKTMLIIHNTHKSIQGLVNRRLAPYTQECLMASAQLITPEAHYNGGKAQMSQDYIDQLKGGSYLLEIEKINTYDSIEKTYKPDYVIRKQKDKAGIVKRKFSSIKEYGITVGDAQITKTVYEDRIIQMLGKQIDALSAASISRQQLMTAQQQGLTAKAQGEKKLVEVEYAKKVEQTNQVVAAQTKVMLAEQYKLEQKTSAEAAIFEAQVVRTNADAEAYKASRLVSAGLSPWDKADFEMKTKIGIATQLSKISLPSTYISSGNNSSNSSLIDALLSTQLINTTKK